MRECASTKKRRGKEMKIKKYTTLLLILGALVSTNLHGASIPGLDWGPWIFNSTTDTLDAAVIGTTQTPFATTIPLHANRLVAGKTFQVTACVQITTSSSPPTITWRWKLGSAVVYASTAGNPGNSQTNQGYCGSWPFQILTDGASGTVEFGGINGTIAPFSRNTTAQAVTLNTTVDNDLALSIEYSAGTAGNTASLRQLKLYHEK
jgi:hypothetical protein